MLDFCEIEYSKFGKYSLSRNSKQAYQKVPKILRIFSDVKPHWFKVFSLIICQHLYHRFFFLFAMVAVIVKVGSAHVCRFAIFEIILAIAIYWLQELHWIQIFSILGG